jgi:low affinity Fe/Cu permease
MAATPAKTSKTSGARTSRPVGAFGRFANRVADWSGRPTAFLFAAAVIVIWAVTGPIFDFSDTWQLVINTGTTIVTFLMVFLIQNTQNREAMAARIKLDELIRATEGARNALVAAEDLDDDALEQYVIRFKAFAEEARRRKLWGLEDTASSPLDENVA